MHPPIYRVAVCKAFFEKVAALNQRDFPAKYEVDILLPDGSTQTCFDIQPHQVNKNKL